MRSGRCDTAVVEIDEIDSTNAEALRRAVAGERGPLWISAARQTSGRGRAGRSWQTEAGALAASLLLSPGCPPDRLYQLSLLTGVAAFDAIALLHTRANAQRGLAPRLKWPNDVLAGQAKIAGILIESTTLGSDTLAVIGIGVNITAAPRIEGRPTAAIADWGITVAPRDLLAAIDASLGHWLEVWQAGARFDLVRAAWLERAGPLGEPVSVVAGSETICGVFAGMDDTGALLVDTAPSNPAILRRFTFGDVCIAPRHTEGLSQR